MSILNQSGKSVTIGLALSGSGNRTAFYIGFLEILTSAGINPDYITACSGGSVVAAVYAAGSLSEFKEYFFKLTRKELVRLLTSKKGEKGLFSLDLIENDWRRFTKSLTFNDVPIKMSFMAVDLESGQLVDLCMGDLARSVRISCTVPGFFEPVTWGNRLLIDGGLLCIVPITALKRFKPDITIGIDMRTTPHIFSSTQINIKKFINWAKKAFYVNRVKNFLRFGEPASKVSGIFSVIGRSIDLVIDAEKNELNEDATCDLMITPNFKKISLPRLVKINVSEVEMKRYYRIGQQTAKKYLPKIRQLIESKH